MLQSMWTSRSTRRSFKPTQPLGESQSLRRFKILASCTQGASRTKGSRILLNHARWRKLAVNNPAGLSAGLIALSAKLRLKSNRKTKTSVAPNALAKHATEVFKLKPEARHHRLQIFSGLIQPLGDRARFTGVDMRIFRQ